MSRDLSVLTEMIEEEQAAGRDLSDAEVVKEVNSWAGKQHSIALACVYSKDGKLVIKYARDDVKPQREVPELLGDDIDRIEGGHLVCISRFFCKERRRAPCSFVPIFRWLTDRFVKNCGLSHHLAALVAGVAAALLPLATVHLRADPGSRPVGANSFRHAAITRCAPSNPPAMKSVVGRRVQRDAPAIEQQDEALRRRRKRRSPPPTQERVPGEHEP